MNVKIMLPDDVHASVKDAAAENQLSLQVICRRTLVEFGCVNVTTREELKKAADDRGVSIAQFLNTMIPKLGLTDESVKAIMLKIPKELLGNQVMLEQWISARCKSLTQN